MYQNLGGSCDPVGSPTARSSRGAILNGMVLCGNQNLGSNSSNNNHFEQILWLICKAPLNRNPVAALGTLVLLSYSKLIRFIIAALQYMVLDYPDGSAKIAWLYGNVQYFTLDHIPQFVAATIILIASGLFTVLLFFGQWIPHCMLKMESHEMD